MSIGPQASRALATRFSSWILSEMRAATAIAASPRCRIAAATSSQGARLRAEIATLAPASAKASAMARPMPRLEPVTIATFPVSSKRFMAERSQQEDRHADEEDDDRGEAELDQPGKADPGPIMLLILGIDHRHEPASSVTLSTDPVQPNRRPRQAPRGVPHQV